MSYASQSNDICGRTWGKQRKLEAQLEANWQRPKHMHHKTYARLLAAILACEQARDDWLAGAMVRLMGGLDDLRKRFPDPPTWPACNPHCRWGQAHRCRLDKVGTPSNRNSVAHSVAGNGIRTHKGKRT
ncbi:MAG: hypothetical protein IV097_18250 [Burkholderiaceae bacterium]|nr:hypothetical protein [Burkholderiaceae bacterium]